MDEPVVPPEAEEVVKVPFNWPLLFVQVAAAICMGMIVYAWATQPCPYTYQEFVADYQKDDYAAIQKYRHWYVDWYIPGLDRVVTKTFYEVSVDKNTDLTVWPKGWRSVGVVPRIKTAVPRVRGWFGVLQGRPAITYATVD